jgi:hypothetical protein
VDFLLADRAARITFRRDMGLFDIFKAKPKGKAGHSERPKPVDKVDKEIARFADSVHKRAANYDRQEALEALAKIGTPDAAAAMLKRFTFAIDPSITDQEEKEQAFRAIVGVGAGALPAIKEFCTKAESVTYPLKMMREILDDEQYVGEVIAMLGKWDTEYDRNVDPKIQLIEALEHIKDARVRPAVERFLEDVNEPARFQAVTTLLAQDAAESAGPLAVALAREEAVRTINRIAEGLVARGWPIPEPERAKLAPKLPRGFAVDDAGVVRRR